MSEIKVSVIIPIYNGAEFLEKGLLMLTRQTLEDIEFICVNDASTDNSLNILLAFKQVFPERFVVINSERNRGPGGARNIGVSYARGEYIGFMDQDDFLHCDMFKMLYEKAKAEDCDIVSCGYRNKQTEVDSYPYDINGVLDDEKRLEMSQEILYIWNKIYRKSMVDKMSMLFREGVSNDDTDFCIEAILRAEKAASIGRCLYYYSFNGKSVTRSNYVDIEKQFREARSLFTALKNRVTAAGMDRIYPQIIDFPLNVYAKGILKFLFDRENFEFNDYKEYIRLFDEYKEYFLKFQKKGSNLVKDIIFNQIDDDDYESYRRIVKLKELLINSKSN